MASALIFLDLSPRRLRRTDLPEGAKQAEGLAISA